MIAVGWGGTIAGEGGLYDRERGGSPAQGGGAGPCCDGTFLHSC